MPIAINPAQAAAKSSTQIVSLISVRGIGANAPGPREGPGASFAANHEFGRIRDVHKEIYLRSTRESLPAAAKGRRRSVLSLRRRLSRAAPP